MVSFYFDFWKRSLSLVSSSLYFSFNRAVISCESSRTAPVGRSCGWFSRIFACFSSKTTRKAIPWRVCPWLAIASPCLPWMITLKRTMWLSSTSRRTSTFCGPTASIPSNGESILGSRSIDWLIDWLINEESCVLCIPSQGFQLSMLKMYFPSLQVDGSSGHGDPTGPPEYLTRSERHWDACVIDRCKAANTVLPDLFLRLCV